jgi:hypothetical protein
MRTMTGCAGQICSVPHTQTGCVRPDKYGQLSRCETRISKPREGV